MTVITKNMIRDILALSPKGMSIHDVITKVKTRIQQVSHNEIMGFILELEKEGRVKYNMEIGTWRSTIRLV